MSCSGCIGFTAHHTCGKEPDANAEADVRAADPGPPPPGTSALRHYKNAALPCLDRAVEAVREARDIAHECGYRVDEGYMEAALALLRHAEGEMKK